MFKVLLPLVRMVWLVINRKISEIWWIWVESVIMIHRAIWYDPHMTHLWPTCWNFPFKSNVKIRYETMPQTSLFLARYWSTVLCTEFLRMKFLDTTCFKTAWGSKLPSHQWWFSDSPDTRFTHLSDANVFF